MSTQMHEEEKGSKYMPILSFFFFLFHAKELTWRLETQSHCIQNKIVWGPCTAFLFSGCCIAQLSVNHKRGAGVLDLRFESPNELLTCGYDTFIRLWDLRTHTWYELSFIHCN